MKNAPSLSPSSKVASTILVMMLTTALISLFQVAPLIFHFTTTPVIDIVTAVICVITFMIAVVAGSFYYTDEIAYWIPAVVVFAAGRMLDLTFIKHVSVRPVYIAVFNFFSMLIPQLCAVIIIQFVVFLIRKRRLETDKTEKQAS